MTKDDSNISKEYACGLGSFEPECMQTCGNIKAFIALFSSQIIVAIANGTYFLGTLRTIERRFGLSSQQVGVLQSLGDIIQTCLLIFIGYFARKTHKPRFLGFLAIFSSIGMLLSSLPYFVYGPLTHDVAATISTLNGTSVKNTEFEKQMCDIGTNLTQNCVGHGGSTRTSNDMAYSIFVAAFLLIGLGTSGLSTLGMSFIDENTNPADSGIYLGIAGATYAVGPVLGFLLAAATTGLPEDLIGNTGISKDDPAFIGCWWLGGVIFGTISFLLLTLLVCIPKHFPPYFTYHKKAALESKKDFGGTDTSKSAFVNELREFLRSFLRVLRNAGYVLLVAGSVLALYLIVGIFINLSRYLEIHFGMAPMEANIATAVSGAFMAAFGNLVGGYLLKRRNLQPTGCALVVLIVKFWMLALVTVLMLLPCHQPTIQGLQQPNSRLINVSTVCSQACSCDRDSFQMVCSNDEQLYFSPCHAGCTIHANQTYTDCSCTSDPDVLLSEKFCKPKCWTRIVYLVVFAILILVASVARVPATVLLFRMVDPDLKAFALGIQGVLFNALVFVPGPIMFGTLFDSACLLWQTTCGKRGACLQYDVTLYRYYMHGVVVGILSVAFMFAVALYIVVRKKYRTAVSDLNMPDMKVPTVEKNVEQTRM